jgi:hypothetical protein
MMPNVCIQFKTSPVERVVRQSFILLRKYYVCVWLIFSTTARAVWRDPN